MHVSNEHARANLSRCHRDAETGSVKGAVSSWVRMTKPKMHKWVALDELRDGWPPEIGARRKCIWHYVLHMVGSPKYKLNSVR